METGSHFDASRAELFEALGHPTRVKILRTLETKPMGFAELKRGVGIESSGHLQFHLGKLNSLVSTNAEGSYMLTDDGREAIRVLNAIPASSGQIPLVSKSPKRRANWLGPTLAIIAIAILAGAGAGYFIGMDSPRTASTTTLTSTVIQACAGQPVWNVNSSSSLVPVLLMKPNTTAYACVTYQTWWKGNLNYNFTGTGFSSTYLGTYPSLGTYLFYPFSVSNEQCNITGNGGGCYPNASHAFRISVFPTSVNYTVYTDYVSVLYVITSFGNSTGYYSNSVPYQYCTSMPLAVGHAAAEVNGSDFGPLISPKCLLLPLSPVAVSVSGMGVVYLKPW